VLGSTDVLPECGGINLISKQQKDVGLASSINWASSKKWDGIDDI
jgi:hypothetical protein